MLVLTFRIADAPFAIAVGRVVEVVPRVALRPVPGAPESLAGLLHYRGKAVPVVDLAIKMGHPGCGDRLNTRIILVEVGAASLIGLVAERVDDVREIDEDDEAMAGKRGDDGSFLGAVYQVDGALVQLIEPGPLVKQPAFETAEGS